MSDTQAVILSAACAREDGNLLPVTASLKGGAVNMVLNSLIKKELAEEVPAEPGAPVWREDEDGTPLTLRATAAAYEALGIVGDTGADGAPEEEPATDMADAPESLPTDAHGTNTPRKARQGTKQEALIAHAEAARGRQHRRDRHRVFLGGTHRQGGNCWGLEEEAGPDDHQREA